jgi:hypothetical protein
MEVFGEMIVCWYRLSPGRHSGAGEDFALHGRCGSDRPAQIAGNRTCAIAHGPGRSRGRALFDERVLSYLSVVVVTASGLWQGSYG